MFGRGGLATSRGGGVVFSDVYGSYTANSSCKSGATIPGGYSGKIGEGVCDLLPKPLTLFMNNNFPYHIYDLTKNFGTLFTTIAAGTVLLMVLSGQAWGFVQPIRQVLVNRPLWRDYNGLGRALVVVAVAER